MKRKSNIIAALAFCMYLASVAVICFMHGSRLPNITGTWMGLQADKVVHAVMFLPFIPLAYFTFKRGKTRRFASMFMLTLLLAFGAGTAYLTEIIQEKYCHRTYETADFVADCIGLGCGFLLVTAWIFIKTSRNRR